MSSDWKSLQYSLTPPPRVTIGLIALANDCTIESDMHAYLLRRGVHLYTNRIYSPRQSSIDSLKRLRTNVAACVANLMPDMHLDVIAFGCTSGAVAIGTSALAECIQEVRPSVLVADPMSAAIKGLSQLGCQRIALLTPYSGDVNIMLEEYLEQRGVSVVAKGFWGMSDDFERSRVATESFGAAVSRLIESVSVDGVFVSCTGLPTAHVVDKLEQRLGVPVVTSNQALAWNALRLAGDSVAESGRGQLMQV